MKFKISHVALGNYTIPAHPGSHVIETLFYCPLLSIIKSIKNSAPAIYYENFFCETLWNLAVSKRNGIELINKKNSDIFFIFMSMNYCLIIAF